MLDNIRIVLVSTSHPGNIGSTARAMKTMGLKQLVLVNPKKYPHSQAIDMAAGADDILDAAVVVDNLQAAISDCQLVLGASARPRGIPLPGLTPRQSGEVVCQHAQNSEVAIVFGREHAGLTNDELLKCNYHVFIPSNPDYSSLNLAQAVQVLCYECRIHSNADNSIKVLTSDESVSLDDMDKFYKHLEQVLIEIDFLKPSNPKRLMQRLRRLFNRAQLERLELNILRGILSNIQRMLKTRSDDE